MSPTCSEKEKYFIFYFPFFHKHKNNRQLEKIFYQLKLFLIFTNPHVGCSTRKQFTAPKDLHDECQNKNNKYVRANAHTIEDLLIVPKKIQFSVGKKIKIR